MAGFSKDPVSWPLLPYPQGGVMEWPSLDRSVRDAIRIIVMTRPGEQLMRPRFGAGLQNFLDDGNTLATRRRIQAALVENLQNYEKRAAFDRVDVDPVDGSPAELHVQIHYRLLRTGVAQQVGLTLRVG